jgi:hypothetical protein
MNESILPPVTGQAQSPTTSVGTPSGRGWYATSGAKTPCPICQRTKDQDCHFNIDGRINCRHKKGRKNGEVVLGSDGIQYALTENTPKLKASLWEHFVVHKPIEKGSKRHLRAVPSGVIADPVPAVQTLLAVPLPEHFSIATYDAESMLEQSSWQDGELWFYDDNNRQERKVIGDRKEIKVRCKSENGEWPKIAKGSNDCPCWNERLISPTIEGVPIFGEGEKVAACLCNADILGLSMPGHLAMSIDHCQTALKRLKEKGLTTVAYLADHDEQGRKKAALMAQAALLAGLPFVGVNAGEIWPDLPSGGSVDDLTIEKAEIIASLDQAFRDKLAEINAANKIVNITSENYQSNNIAASTVIALDEETDEKQAALMRLVSQIVDADVAGDAIRKAALMSQTWRLGVPSVVTEGLVLEQWAQNKGIGTALATEPVEGRTIGSGATQGIKTLLPGFITDNSLGLLIGDGGVGKSCMALAMAYSIIHGSKGFLDHEEPSLPTQKILYIGTDGGAGAYDMLSTYALGIAEKEQWQDDVMFWCEEAGKRKPWTLTLYNLELLHKELAKGEIRMVVIDTINSVFQGANISPYLGPVDSYLRLLKAIVCPYGPLLMLGHTNRSGSGIKAIGGHPAFQEVPDVLHSIEKQKQLADDGTQVYKWKVHKLRGESSREFSYSRVDGELKVVDGSHFFTNCGDKVLAAIEGIRALGGHPMPKDVVQYTKEASSSVRTALLRLKSKGFIEKRGACFHLTDLGKQRLKQINK